MAGQLHVSIAAEPVYEVAGITITNSMFTAVLVTLLLLIIGLMVSRKLKMTPESHGQQIVEVVVDFIASLCQSIGGKKWSQYFTIIGSIFIFILVSNWSGLLPGVGTIMVYPEGKPHLTAESTRVGEVFAAELESAPVTEELDSLSESDTGHDVTSTGENVVFIEEHGETGHDVEESHVKAIPLFRAPTADLNTTFALAVVAVVYIQFVGIKNLGLGYFKKFINFSSPIMFFVGVLEIISEISKIISFAFRLFGNIFAGEVLLAVIAFLIPIAASVPFIGLEIFVGFIQAFVFAILAVVFMSLAVQSHDH